MPTICFIARNDFEDKPGGDTVQWRIYDRAARAAGFQTTTWFADGPIPKADVFHAFNIDRPLEIYPRLATIARRNKPFIISTIHHPNPWLEKFRAAHPPSGRLGRWLYRSPLGSTVRRSESVKEPIRLIQQRRLRRAPDLFPPWLSRIQWILREAQQVWLLSAEEGRWLERDFNCEVAGRATVVPNWVEGIDPSQSGANALGTYERPPVIVVGRVEARKNVLRVARLAEEARRHVVFVGRGNPNEASFVDEFKAFVEQAQYSKWIPGVPREHLGACYAQADFLLNASYVEVSPLVDIEALAFGCPIVTTKYALHHELLPRATRAVDAYDDADVLEILGSSPSRTRAVTVVDPVRVQAGLAAHYRKLASV